MKFKSKQSMDPAAILKAAQPPEVHTMLDRYKRDVQAKAEAEIPERVRLVRELIGTTP